jgi:hypothetical protein
MNKQKKFKFLRFVTLLFVFPMLSGCGKPAGDASELSDSQAQEEASSAYKLELPFPLVQESLPLEYFQYAMSRFPRGYYDGKGMTGDPEGGVEEIRESFIWSFYAMLLAIEFHRAGLTLDQFDLEASVQRMEQMEFRDAAFEQLFGDVQELYVNHTTVESWAGLIGYFQKEFVHGFLFESKASNEDKLKLMESGVLPALRAFPHPLVAESIRKQTITEFQAMSEEEAQQQQDAEKSVKDEQKPAIP